MQKITHILHVLTFINTHTFDMRKLLVSLQTSSTSAGMTYIFPAHPDLEGPVVFQLCTFIFVCSDLFIRTQEALVLVNHLLYHSSAWSSELRLRRPSCVSTPYCWSSSSMFRSSELWRPSHVYFFSLKYSSATHWSSELWRASCVSTLYFNTRLRNDLVIRT